MSINISSSKIDTIIGIDGADNDWLGRTRICSELWSCAQHVATSEIDTKAHQYDCEWQIEAFFLPRSPYCLSKK